MRISDLAQTTGTPAETIRFYEREGLLPPARRTHNNYRLYEHAHVEQLALIRRCRGLDMTLEEVRKLLHLRERPAQDCAEVNALLDAHIEHVTRRIRELRVLEKNLKVLRSTCTSPSAIADCGILSRLERQAPVAAAPMRTRHPRGPH